MVLPTALDNTVRANSTPSSQLRQRKQLPPLSSPPTELSMDTSRGSVPSSADPLADTNGNNLVPAKTDDVQLLRLHAQFARAFKLNDAAQLLPFLHKDVTFVTHDGTVVRGASAVLGRLVGPKMGKLSGALHVKQARATRCGDAQSVFVYEHGLVFKEPLYSEVMDWHTDATGTYAVTRITHTMLCSNMHVDAGPPTSVADVVKVVAALPHRLSHSDDDDHLNNNNVPSSRRSSLYTENRTTASVAACDTRTDRNIGAVVTRVAVATKLSPIRRRKLVNAFVTVESMDGSVLWKSSVAKKQLLPTWNGIELELPPPLDAIVVVTLWDYGLFRSLRVATTQVTAAQLLADERDGLAHVELKSMGLLSSSVELTCSITRLGTDRAWRPRSESMISTVAAVDAAMAVYGEDGDDNATTAVVRKSSIKWLPLEFLMLDSARLMATSAAGVVLVCLALLWLHTNGQLMAK